MFYFIKLHGILFAIANVQHMISIDSFALYLGSSACRIGLELTWDAVKESKQCHIMKCLILSPISNQTPFALARGVKEGFWHLKTRLLVLVFSLFKGLSMACS